MSQLQPTGFRLRVLSAQDIDAAREADTQRRACLADTIHSRIIERLGGRVHELEVSSDGDSVVLRGRCATYYSKQLAQHEALGVLDEEHLLNQITVTKG